MQIKLDLNNIEDYRLFLRIKGLPKCHFVGRIAEVPDEYASLLGIRAKADKVQDYTTMPFLFDYQRDGARMAIRKRKFAAFWQCGLGKTLLMSEFARHAVKQIRRRECGLIVSPLMVIRQTLEEFKTFYEDKLPIDWIEARDLSKWLTAGKGRLGIVNYDALREDTPQGRLGLLALDESGYMKAHYGHWGRTLIRLGRGVEWKLAMTGTPAPNDRIEYANHAVFLDAFPTVNSFLARFFVNRGQTNERWELKPHAVGPFYRALSHWCIFLENPATYGWRDNTANIPPIHVHIHDVPMTGEQQALVYERTGELPGFASNIGGITSRSVLSQIAKGNHRGATVPTNKTAFIRKLVDSWPEESTIIWCLYNREQETMEAAFPEAASLKGSTPYEERERLISDFKAGRRRVIISKPKVMGLGLNLQIATRQVFSGLQDSFEAFHQAVKRSNRIGSTRPLNVHLPITEIERPMIDTVLRKAKRVQQDTEEQERIFKEHANVG